MKQINNGGAKLSFRLSRLKSGNGPTPGHSTK